MTLSNKFPSGKQCGLISDDSNCLSNDLASFKTLGPMCKCALNVHACICVLGGYVAEWLGMIAWIGFSKNMMKNCKYVFPKHLSL